MSIGAETLQLGCWLFHLPRGTSLEIPLRYFTGVSLLAPITKELPRSKKEFWFCDENANPVTSGNVPGMLHDSLRFARFTSLTLPHSYPKTYSICIRDMYSTECSGYSFLLVTWPESAGEAQCYLKFHI